ncbi:MAG: hypothetical protein GY828_08285 [Candidatus Gracilibacteria bacterium]|nr:hypothetical protein [Candidatus Gracilibacteria bacterium]
MGNSSHEKQDSTAQFHHQISEQQKMERYNNKANEIISAYIDGKRGFKKLSQEEKIQKIENILLTIKTRQERAIKNGKKAFSKRLTFMYQKLSDFQKQEQEKYSDEIINQEATENNEFSSAGEEKKASKKYVSEKKAQELKSEALQDLEKIFEVKTSTEIIETIIQEGIDFDNDPNTEQNTQSGSTEQDHLRRTGRDQEEIEEVL